MLFTVPSRRVAALAVAASGLATVLSGAFAPAATAAPSTTAAPAATVVAAKASWFVDPRTPAQRQAELAVPGKPEKYRGKLRETRAVYRTRDGALAVPMRFAFGNLVTQGQALTLDGGGLFAGGSNTLTPSAKAQIAKLASSLTNASSVRCEGYADYSGPASEAKSLARTRAAKVCQRLASENPGLKTSSVSYGANRPAIVGGAPKQRELNRRVVVEMTGTRPVAPPPPAPPAPQAKVPGAPVLVHADGYDGFVRYGFNAPTSDGGAPITGYQVSTGGSWVPVQLLLGRAATRCRGCGPQAQFEASLGGDLDAQELLKLRVRAVNRVGAGAPSNTLSTTVYDTPSAPTALQVVGGDGLITTTFGAPTTDGGSPVAYYEISYDGGESWTYVELTQDASWTVTKEVLDGTSYDVRVRAVNMWGSGAVASLDKPTLVATVPSAPWLDDPDPVGSTIDFTVEAPDSDGGSPVTGYEITIDGGESWNVLTFEEGEGLTFSLDLTFGHGYEVRVRAVNARGKGAESKSRAFTAATVPSAPYISDSEGNDGVITTVVEPAEHDNGSAITEYQISYDGGETFAPFDTSGPAPWTVVQEGFVNGTTYGVRVRAVNAKGAGPTYGAVVLVATLPDEPRLDGPVVSGTHASLTFEAPEFDGGTPVVSYELSKDGGESWANFAYTETDPRAFAFDLDDLTLGHEYSVRVRALNERGPGAGSKSRVFTPVTVPDAPSGVVATVTGTSVEVTFDAPVADATKPVTGYQVSIDAEEWVDVDVVDGAFTLTGQAVGFHTYAVRAVNAAGPSDAATSDPVEVVAPPVVQPAAPTVVDAVSNVNLMWVTWTPGDAGTEPITRWEASIDGGPWAVFDFAEPAGESDLFGEVSIDCGGQDCISSHTSLRVRAVTASGESEPSVAYAFHPGDPDNGGIPGGDPR